MRKSIGPALGLGLIQLLAVSRTMAAEPPRPMPVARATLGDGPSELAVGWNSTGELRATVCAVKGCSLEQGLPLDLPADRRNQPSAVRFEIVPMAKGRVAVIVTANGAIPGRAWQSIVAAGTGLGSPKIVFQGETGLIRGEEGLRAGPIVQVSGSVDEKGSRRIVVGEQREDLTLCGRPTILSPNMLDPTDLSLKPAKVQRLGSEERAAAPRLRAERLVSPTTGTDVDAMTLGWGNASLLRAVSASSAVGWPAALTDGDLESSWGENRGGAGRGEFVVLQAPGDVPFSAFDLVVRPSTREVKNGAGPKELWIATRHSVYHVAFEEDPWKFPKAVWHVNLPKPEPTNCVAVVTESSYEPATNVQVTLTEIAARSEFADSSVDALVAALAGGGPRAQAAASVLASRGQPAYQAVARVFQSLDESGRRVALEVLDNAPCPEAAPTYVVALCGKTSQEVRHAADRLRRCREQAAPALLDALTRAKPEDRARMGEVLATIAPADALRALVPKLVGPAPRRRSLRDIVARAARAPQARAAIAELLNEPSLTPQAQVDFLRAVSGQLVGHEAQAMDAVGRLLASQPDWRWRYLLLEPMQVLALREPRAKQWLTSTIRRDSSPFVRAQAAASVQNVTSFREPLLGALVDREVRVRESAASVLATPSGSFAQAPLASMLADDDWPIARAAAARSLGAFTPSVAIRDALLEALDDDSALVRQSSVEALVRHSPQEVGPELVDLLEDDKEALGVRVAAARALGQLCYAPAADALTDLARHLSSPALELTERALGGRALAALAQLHPTDLPDRLKPLLSGEQVPTPARQAARAALAVRRHCRNR